MAHTSGQRRAQECAGVKLLFFNDRAPCLALSEAVFAGEVERDSKLSRWQKRHRASLAAA